MVTIFFIPLIFLLLYLTKPHKLNGFLNINATVISKNSLGSVVKYNSNKIILFGGDYQLGDKISFSGYPVKATTANFSAKNISYVVFKAKIHHITRLSNFRNWFESYVSTRSATSKHYLPLIVLGIKNEDTTPLYLKSISLNVVHLIVISGFHISLLFFVIEKILLKVKVNKYFATFTAMVPIIFYLYLLNFPLSALRATLMLFISIISKYYFKKNNRFNNVSIAMLFILLLRPWAIHSYSFILSFMAVSVVYIVIDVFKSNWKRMIVSQVLVYLLLLPIIILLGSKVTIFGILFSYFMTPVFTLMYILSFILMPFPFMLDYIYIVFSFIMESISALNISVNVKLNLKQLNIIYLCCLYSFIIGIWLNLYMVKKNTGLIVR